MIRRTLRALTVRWPAFLLGVCVVLLAPGCGGGGGASPDATVQAALPPAATPCGDPPDPSTTRPPGWTNTSHHKSAPPDYARVFPDDAVLRMDIRIAPCHWQAMLDDGAIQIGRLAAPARRVLPVAVAVGCTGPGLENEPEVLRDTPMWVPVTIGFEGNSWTRVGLRLKGSSSLIRSWDMGLHKLPFRLDFDRFDDVFPAIDGQRMFGFEKLSFANNVVDASFLREKLSNDLLRQHGVPAARSAWVRVYLDRGAGNEYIGLYTMTEIPAKPMLQAQFGNASGNLYKPQGPGANWRPRSAQTDAVFQTTFDKENNAGAADWSDVQAAVDALQHPDRNTDVAAWRTALEQRLNVSRFLRWMSANAVMGNGDAYGFIAHNYYLYADPADPVPGRLAWIPWDHDRSMTCPALDISYPAVQYPGSRWPLFRYLLDDPVYRSQYATEAAAFLSSPGFAATALGNRLDAAQALIAPYVTGAEGEAIGTRRSALNGPGDFDTAHAQLRALLAQRRALAGAALPLPP